MIEYVVVILTILLILLWVAWDKVGAINPYPKNKRKQKEQNDYSQK